MSLLFNNCQLTEMTDRTSGKYVRVLPVVLVHLLLVFGCQNPVTSQSTIDQNRIMGGWIWVRSFLFMVTLLIVGCDGGTMFDEEDGDSESRIGNMPFDGHIEFFFWEYHQNTTISPPELALVMRTEQQYPCCNYPLVYDALPGTHSLEIVLIGIGDIPNGACLSAVGPANAREFLDLKAGDYDLVFGFQSSQDSFSLSISDSVVSVMEISAEFSQPQHSLYFRYIPSSFSYTCTAPDTSEWVCDDFKDSLSQKISMREVVFPDTVPTPYYPWSQVFTYENDEDFDAAGDYLKSYSEIRVDSLEGIYITIRNWMNKTYYSWM